jgi:hypothetical protein
MFKNDTVFCEKFLQINDLKNTTLRMKKRKIQLWVN